MVALHLQSDPTVREVIDQYLPHGARGAAPRAHAERKRLLDLFCATHGELRVSEARPFHLRLWVDAQTQWRSDWTVKRAIATVQRPFNWAHKLGITSRNPFWGVSGHDGKRRRPLEPDEWQALLRHTDATFRPLLVFLKFTGARPGEASAARWSDLQLDVVQGLGWITLTEHKTSRKTGRSRVIVLAGPVVKLLVWLRRRAIPDQQTIFINARGEPWTRNALSLRVQRIRRRAGLPEDATLYGLRHAFATDAVIRGLDVRALAELLGHTTTRMTEHYLHTAGRKDYLAAAVRKALGK